MATGRCQSEASAASNAWRAPPGNVGNNVGARVGDNVGPLVGGLVSPTLVGAGVGAAHTPRRAVRVPAVRPSSSRSARGTRAVLILCDRYFAGYEGPCEYLMSSVEYP